MRHVFEDGFLDGTVIECDRAIETVLVFAGGKFPLLYESDQFVEVEHGVDYWRLVETRHRKEFLLEVIESLQQFVEELS